MMLALLPILAALGIYASMDPEQGASLYLYRVACLVAAVPAVTMLIRNGVPGRSVSRTYVILTASWCIWAPLSLAWTPAYDEGIREVISISFGLVGGLILVSFTGGHEMGVRAISRGWVWAFIATGAVAMWEIGSGQHLSRLVRELEGRPVEGVYSTFGNPNDYACFLLATLPGLVTGLRSSRSRVGRSAHVVLLLVWCQLIVATQSRTGAVGALAALLLLVFWLSRVLGRRLIVPGVVALYLAGTALLTVSVAKPGLVSVGSLTAAFVGDNSRSDGVRANLTLLGARYVVESGGLGLGAGAYEARVAADSGRADLAGVTNAHDSLIELTSQYGAPVSVPFFALLFVVFRAGRKLPPRMRLRHGRRDVEEPTAVRHLRISVQLGLIALIAGGLASSSTLSSPWWWILLGTVASQASLLADPPTGPERPLPRIKTSIGAARQ